MKKFLVVSIGILISGLLNFLSTFATSHEISEPELWIKAINPGYTIDGKSNVGEMIEIVRRSSDHPISLAGATVGYTNSSGNYSTLFEFPENSWMTGESILLRLASSPESGLASENYTKTLAFKASITLELDGEVIDRVCWTGKEGCSREFRSSEPSVLVRNELGEFEHLSNYEPVFDEQAYYLEPEKDELKPSQCKNLVFSEILSYYDSVKSEQFIELYNSSSEQILMDGCSVRYKNKNYDLKGILKAEHYFIYRPVEFSLTKNPTNKGTIELIDTDGKIIDRLDYPNGQKKGTAYAMIGFDDKGEEIWRTTYAPTPGEANNFQEFKTCEIGKVINKETGNCVKITSVTEKICGEGQYLNILTGRCKKATSNSETICKEGYVLNPETRRCRKIKENTGANYSIKPETFEEKSSFIALYAVVIVVGLGLIYLIYEFRKEILKFFGKVFRRFR